MRAYRFAPVMFTALLALSLAACSLPSRSAPPAAVAALPEEALRPGDALSGMRLSTGSDEVVSLWLLCPAGTVAGPVTTVACDLPDVPQLAIGPSGFVLPATAKVSDWSRLRWELSLDGSPVNLAAFGAYEVLRPRKAPHGRDAYFAFPAWDVVLSHPTPGQHTLRAAVQLPPASAKTLAATNGPTFEWIVNFTIPAPAQ
jgi:hypothetical protein